MTSHRHKTSVRFQQLNKLVDDIGPTLQTSQFAVVMVCYRHAKKQGYFCVSCRRIAKSTNLSIRQVNRLMQQLISLGVIERIHDHRGPRPVVHRIKYEVAKRDADTSKKTQPTTKENGDTHDQ